LVCLVGMNYVYKEYGEGLQVQNEVVRPVLSGLKHVDCTRGLELNLNLERLGRGLLGEEVTWTYGMSDEGLGETVLGGQEDKKQLPPPGGGGGILTVFLNEDDFLRASESDYPGGKGINVQTIVGGKGILHVQRSAH